MWYTRYAIRTKSGWVSFSTHYLLVELMCFIMPFQHHFIFVVCCPCAKIVWWFLSVFENSFCWFVVRVLKYWKISCMDWHMKERRKNSETAARLYVTDRWERDKYMTDQHLQHWCTNTKRREKTFQTAQRGVPERQAETVEAFLSIYC